MHFLQAGIVAAVVLWLCSRSHTLRAGPRHPDVAPRDAAETVIHQDSRMKDSCQVLSDFSLLLPDCKYLALICPALFLAESSWGEGMVCLGKACSLHTKPS